MPADRAALYTMKPTIRLIAQDGIVPINSECDSAGPFAKSAKDLAAMLDAMIDPATTSVPEGGYVSAVTGSWKGLRIGVLDPNDWWVPESIEKYNEAITKQMACHECMCARQGADLR
jgi:amidase